LNRYLLVLAATAVPLLSWAQTVDYARSQVTVVSRQMNVPVEAAFKKFTAQIAFDPARPESGKADITIDLASFDIGNDEINADVRGRSWFDAKTHPTARFVSQSVRAAGPGRFEARGPLTIKGRTVETVAPFTVKSDPAGQLFEGAFTLRRLQYSIGEGVWKDTDTVADEVQVKFRIAVLTKPAPPGKTK
jgi:polyisoprenoid-binding protein YceI